MPDRICLIVDESAIRGYLALILQQRQLQTLEAATATEGLRIVEKFGGSLDMILINIQVTGDMNGLDMAHSVRNRFPAIPVILISGYAAVGNLGATGFQFIPKPFVPKTILDAVDRALGAKRLSGCSDATAP